MLVPLVISNTRSMAYALIVGGNSLAECLFLRFYQDWLVVWNIFLFFHILGIIIPIDYIIFFRGVETTDQMNRIDHLTEVS